MPLVGAIVGIFLAGTAYLLLTAMLSLVTPVLIWTCLWFTFWIVVTVKVVRTLIRVTRKVRKSHS